jgi:hypothetical protein
MRFRKNAYYIDTETCGFHGLATLIQWAYEDGEVHLHEHWRLPVQDTLDLIEKFTTGTCVFFNATFDWFHLCKIYTMWLLLRDRCGPDIIPAKIPVRDLALAERDAREGPCVKPKDVVCLMLHSRKGKFQSLMDRHDVKVTKVPTCLAHLLANELEERIELDGILFAKKKNKNAPKWGVYDRIKKGKDDEIDPAFKDVTLKFKPARALKYLAEHCLGLDPEFHSFKDVYPATEHKLAELGYAPFALGACPEGEEKDWKVVDKHGKTVGRAWPRLIHEHIAHWRDDEEARRYARDDVKYTRLLDEYFEFPEESDNDSTLACMVAAVRWHGFTIDTRKVSQLLAKSKRVFETSPVNPNKPTEVKHYIREVMDETEATTIDQSTKKANLEKIRDKLCVEREALDPELTVDMECVHCGGTRTQIGDAGEEFECSHCEGSGIEPGGELCIRCLGEGCPRCSDRGFLLFGPTLAAQRADEILHIKAAGKEIELYEKLLRAGRFHASFKVIGTLSSRMAGGDGLNAQGIKGSEATRSAFPLMWEGMQLCGGDFDGFEVTLADAVFQDDNLREDLLAGKSLHTSMAQELYPTKSEDQIKASKGFKDGGDVDMYTRGKQAVFATLYGGDAGTINKKLAIDKAVAERAFDGLQKRYPGIKIARERVAEDFAALEQHGAIGTGKITYKAPKDFVETFLGFRRWFPLENKIAKALYDLAHDVPKHWRKYDFTILRRDREQTPAGAVSSALYGAAFQIQAANIRAANNHLIQSPGAMITKDLQRQIWDLQPAGINEWIVAPINVHDEVLSVTRPDMVSAVTDVVIRVVESYRAQVPLIGMKWVTSMTDWAGKKGGVGAEQVHISPHGITTSALEDDEPYVEPISVEDLEEIDELPAWVAPEDTVAGGYL